jgi:asparagine synthase (glutamine-hydrolysing)
MLTLIILRILFQIHGLKFNNMCGIAGIVAADVKNYRDNLQQMIDSLRHRGPDEIGTFFFNNCALGHTRLSIVDLKSGQQPMISNTSPVGITFNGEIYGYKNIRSIIKDYPFSTSSDTEIILALHHNYGKDLLPHLPGMFAFAIWSDSTEELFCARDRFGEKPFFYAFGRKGEFLFASEIKALIASGLINPVISVNSVIYYLQHLYVHPYKTIYENIYVLPPAHKLIYKRKSVYVERYWQLPASRNDIELPEALETFKQLFEAAIEKQLVADVPVGAFLSGGLDSTTVVSASKRHISKLKTFSFGFEGDLSELPYAKEVSQLFKTDHTELIDEHEDISQLLIKMQDIYDEPFADSSNIPTFLLCKLARRYGKVILTGDGGDELLAGYNYWYKPLLLMELEPKAPIWKETLIKLLINITKSLDLTYYEKCRQKSIGIDYRRRYGSIIQAHNAQSLYFSNIELPHLGLYNKEFKCSDSLWSPSGTVDDALRMDLENYMAGDILVKIDRASMANGLELRAPFLDINFASFCVSLPSRLKITTEKDKLILRKAYSHEWPTSIRNRGKQGFGAPVSQWLKRDSVQALKKQFLDDPEKNIFQLISFKNSRHFIEKDDYQTWILLVLSLWMEKHNYALGTAG